jgi:hypothetical protein
MRWRFVDPSHPAEVAAKDRVLGRIDAWWTEFARRSGDLQRVFARQLEMDLPAWMEEHLGSVDEALCWEFGPPLRGSGHRLVVTAESRSELRPLVATLLERAPELPGWEFYPYRPRSPSRTRCARWRRGWAARTAMCRPGSRRGRTTWSR